MNEQQAQQIKQGDVVVYRGRRYGVMGVRARGIAAPYFRLFDDETGEERGLMSYLLVGLPEED